MYKNEMEADQMRLVEESVGGEWVRDVVSARIL
jgi:hypothetical protein